MTKTDALRELLEEGTQGLAAKLGISLPEEWDPHQTRLVLLNAVPRTSAMSAPAPLARQDVEEFCQKMNELALESQRLSLGDLGPAIADVLDFPIRPEGVSLTVRYPASGSPRWTLHVEDDQAIRDHDGEDERACLALCLETARFTVAMKRRDQGLGQGALCRLTRGCILAQGHRGDCSLRTAHP